MNDYEERKQARIDRYRELADKAGKKSDALYQQSHDMISAIPLGEPVHGQRDQNYRNRAWNKMGRSVEEQKKSDYYEAKAQTAEDNTAISSDDPEAINKLKEKLKDLKDAQALMKSVNAYYRKHKTCKGCEGISDATAADLDESMKTANSWETAPFASYMLTNNNAEIHRVQERLDRLKRTQEVGFVGWEFEGGEVVAHKELNRLQVFFDEIPPKAIRKKMKHYGFNWAQSEKAWQRQLNQNAIWAASYLDFLRPLSGESVWAIQPKAPKKEEPQR